MKKDYEFNSLYGINGIIVFALVLSTFTQIRFPGLPIGFSDLFFISYIIYSIGVFSMSMNDINSEILVNEKRDQIGPILYYLMIFLFLLFVGTIYSNFLLTNGAIDTPLNPDAEKLFFAPYHNILAYSYLTVIYVILFIRADIKIGLVAFYTSIFLALCVSIFFIFTFFTNSIFSIDLYYVWTDRLMLFTKSPNHLADFISPLPIFLLYFYSNSQSVLLRLFLIILSVFVLLAVFESQSKASILGLLVAFVYLTSKLIYRIIELKHAFILFIFFILSIFLYVHKFHSESILNLTQNILDSGSIEVPKSLANDAKIRLGLFFNAIELGNKSPVFGVGAGASTGISEMLMGRESHNHLSEVFMSTGYLGLLSYVSLMLFVYSRIHRAKKPILVGAFIVITIVSMFHVQLRQPLFWFYILFLLYFATSEINNLTDKSSKV